MRGCGGCVYGRGRILLQRGEEGTSYATTLECDFKVLSDELEEDEDLHNKLKCDQDTSDEQIAADNVKISTLETSISGKCKCGTNHRRD